MTEATIFSVLVIGSVLLSTIVWLYLVWLTVRLARDPTAFITEASQNDQH